MLKKITLILIIFITGTVCYAQDTIPVWVKQFAMTWKNPMQSGISYFCVDKFNNSFVLIDFTDSLIIGDSLYVNINKQKISSFLLKYDGNGNLSWMYPMVNKPDIISKDIAADNKGGCYITGMYHGLFPISPTLTLDSTKTSGRSYLAKFNNSGQLEWAKGFACAAQLQLSISRIGNLYVKRSNSNVTSYQLGDTIITDLKLNEAIAKFDASGKFYWAKSIVPCKGFLVDSFENIYLYSDFMSKVKVDTFELIPKIAKRSDIFIAKLNTNNEIQWIKHIENVSIRTGNVYKNSLTTDNSGNVYFSSIFRDSLIIFGNKYYAPQYDKIYYFKINTYGQIIWVKVPDGDEPLSQGFSFFYYTTGNKLKGKVKISNSTSFNGKTIQDAGFSGIAYIEMDTAGMVSHLRPLLLPNQFFSPGTGNSYFQLAAMPKNQTIKVQGKTYKNSGAIDMFLLKYDTSYFNGIDHKNNNFIQVSLFPNPANSVCNISSDKKIISGLQVYNSIGELTSNYTNIHSNIFRFNVESLPKGMYIIQIRMESGEFGIKKIIVN
jgi:hypothetical protein